MNGINVSRVKEALNHLESAYAILDYEPIHSLNWDSQDTKDLHEMIKWLKELLILIEG